MGKSYRIIDLKDNKKLTEYLVSKRTVFDADGGAHRSLAVGNR